MSKETKSIIEKTDNAVKTAEAWTAFGTAIWSARGFFTPVIVLGGVMITAVTRIFTLGWEYAVLASIPLFVFSALIWLALAWIWYLRPMGKEKANPVVSKLTENTSLNKDAVEPVARPSISSEEREGIMAVVWDSTKAMVDRKFEESSEAQNRSITTLFANKKSSDAMRFAEIAEMLDARADLIQFDELSMEIAEAVDHLDPIPLCDNWGGRYIYFKGRLEAWDKFNENYHIPAYAPLFLVEPKDLKTREWGDSVNSLPNDEGLEYKHYQLALRAYQNNHSRMRKRMALVAYKSLHGKSANSKYMARFND